MKKSLFILILLSIAVTSLTAQRTRKPVTIDLLRDTPVLFNPSDYPDGVVEKNGLI